MHRRVVCSALVLIGSVCSTPAATAQDQLRTIDLVVSEGRPIRVALDSPVHVDEVGKPVTGVVVASVYAYDRIVIPAGARVRGHVSRIDGLSTAARLRAYVVGNFSPSRHAVLTFDTLVLDDGSEIPLAATAGGGVQKVARRVAEGAEENAEAAQKNAFAQMTSDAMSDAQQKAHDVWESLVAIGEPDHFAELTDDALQQLPFHRQYLTKGTVYDAQLSAPLSFGSVEPTPFAPLGAAPAPDSILKARLVTPLDSARTPKGTSFEAVLTEPVFSPDHQVIFPEGTRLTGTVMRAKAARSFRRNGDLRLLFERAEVPGQPAAQLLGQLHAVEVNAEERLKVDEEGGATLENAKTRLIAPALALLSLRAAIVRDGDPYPSADGEQRKSGSGVGARGVGGYLAMGVVGAVVSMASRPVGLTLTVYGAARKVYTNLFARGRDVTFKADTPVQVRVAPAAPQQ